MAKATINVPLDKWKKTLERVEQMQKRYEQQVANQMDVINRIMTRVAVLEAEGDGAKRALGLLMTFVGKDEFEVSVEQMEDIGANPVALTAVGESVYKVHFVDNSEETEKQDD